MTTKTQIQQYINSHPDNKRQELEQLHSAILNLNPKAQLWFLDGKNEQGKVVSNPNIGYGQLTMQYAGGKTRDFYRVGLSANTSGISVYIMGLSDKNYLKEHFEKRLGKASVTGYCIKFKSLKDIQQAVLMEAIQFGFDQNS